ASIYVKNIKEKKQTNKNAFLKKRLIFTLSYTKKIVIIITIKVGVREPAIKSANKFSKMNTNFNLPLLEKYKEYI
ncbi:hypothetical protein ABHZ54_20525, partial [Bacteroides uniformis]